VTNSTLSGNSTSNPPGGGIGGGGGIRNDGTLIVTSSTLSGNRAGVGGGIANDGTLTVTNSTLSGNSASSGGGIYTESGTANVTNSTLAGNSASSGGGIRNEGTLTVTNSTLSGNTANSNGGGIFAGKAVTLTNTVVANTMQGGDLSVNGASVTFAGMHNLIDDADKAGGLTDGMNGNIVGHPALLGSLASNGGPTLTIPLNTGSPAIAHGDPAVCAAAPVSGVDQRGVTRPGSVCAIGAFEPLLSAIAPTAGVVSGGTSIALTGAGFANGATVTVGGVACGDVQVANSTTLHCTTGAHAVGAVDVVVAQSGQTGTLVGAYTYQAAAALPPPKPGGPAGGVPSALPPTRPTGPTNNTPPSPLPVPR
jgi:predicted outer membrane repeat protein